MKRRIILGVLLMLLLIPMDAFAHSGGTDGNGGHTDRYTGDYHYHHGYSAHSHYDMDGDGDVDCPYEFKDKTNYNSDNGGGDDPKNSSNHYKVKETTVPTSPEAETVTFLDILKAMLSSLLPAICIFFSSSYLLSFIFFILLGESKGCTVSIVSGGVISLIAYVWFIVARLT